MNEMRIINWDTIRRSSIFVHECMNQKLKLSIIDYFTFALVKDTKVVQIQTLNSVKRF